MEELKEDRWCCRFRQEGIESKCQRDLLEEKGEKGLENIYRIGFEMFNKDCLSCNNFYHQKIIKKIEAKKNILCCELTYIMETQGRNAFRRYSYCKEKLLDSNKTTLAYHNYNLISEFTHTILNYLKQNDSLGCSKCSDFLEILEKFKKG